MHIKPFFILLWVSGLCVSVWAAYPRAGYRAQLSTVAHGVSGTVTIVDEDTLLVEHFNYDSGGITVFFYLGTEDSSPAFTAGTPVGPELTGTVFNDDELTVHLTNPMTLDGYTAISVWCVDVSVSFGSGTFIDPNPALSWTFDNNGTQSYILDSYSPPGVPFGTVGQENPTLLLHLNERYQVTVINDGAHPFEVLAKGPTSTDDVVLLSMQTGDNGTMEGDSTIGWVDDGAGTVAFTLSQSLYDAMTVPNKQPGYRCGIHVGAMRGNFDVCLGLPIGDFNGDCLTDLTDFAVFAGSWLQNNIAP